MNTFDYPGSATNFRAFMESIVSSLDRGIWHVSSIKGLSIAYEAALCAPSREGWHIILMQRDTEGNYSLTQQRATFMALEFLSTLTVVHVYDGTLFERVDWPMQYEEIGEPLRLFADEIFSRISKRLTARSQAPRKPETRDLDDWFDYCHACKKQGTRVTLRDISDETNYNYDYVRQRHLEYKAKKHL